MLNKNFLVWCSTDALTIPYKAKMLQFLNKNVRGVNINFINSSKLPQGYQVEKRTFNEFDTYDLSLLVINYRFDRRNVKYGLEALDVALFVLYSLPMTQNTEVKVIIVL